MIAPPPPDYFELMQQTDILDAGEGDEEPCTSGYKPPPADMHYHHRFVLRLICANKLYVACSHLHSTPDGLAEYRPPVSDVEPQLSWCDIPDRILTPYAGVKPLYEYTMEERTCFAPEVQRQFEKFDLSFSTWKVRMISAINGNIVHYAGDFR